MAWCLDGSKPLSEPMLTYYQLNHKEHNSITFYLKLKYSHSRKCVWTSRVRNGGHFVSASMCHFIGPWWTWQQLSIQATGLDAWASRVKCPARFVSHLHEICIYTWVVYSLCFFCCLFITVTWWYVWCFEWASGNQEEVQACLVTLWLFIISCYSLYKTTLGLLCSWFENNPRFHKYSMDFHV